MPGLAAALWLGLLIGVSFLATPVKFQAPTLDLPTALDVGRVTFLLANKVEWGAWLLLALPVLSQRRLLGIILLVDLGLILLAETFWLLPILTDRVEQIIAGQSLPPTSHHLLYVLLEGGKALLLAGVIVANIQRSSKPE